MGEHWDAIWSRAVWWLYAFHRLAQFAFGLAVCGLYGADLTNAAAQKKTPDPKWVYAETVAIFSVFTAIFYFVVTYLERKHGKQLFTYHRLYPHFPVYATWDLILSLLYLIVFIIFGSMFISEDPQGDSGIKRMKAAVYVDVGNWLLWLASGILLFRLWWKAGERTWNVRSLWTRVYI